MSIKFHPSDARLTAFAMGSLELGPSLLVRVHVQVCDACRRHVGEVEEAQGRLLASLPDTQLKSTALRDVLAAIDREPPPMRVAQDFPVSGFSVPTTLRGVDFLPPSHLTADAWVAHLDAPRMGGWRTYLFCAPADTALPEHGHAGDELIAVLEGGFNDGREFVAGDFAENSEGFVHRMHVAPSGRLTALISSRGAIRWNPADQQIGAMLDI